MSFGDAPTPPWPEPRPADLTRALRTSLPSWPVPLEVFASVVDDGGPGRGLIEWSAHLSDACHAVRLTRYFDVETAGNEAVRDALERFAELATMLATPLPPSFLDTTRTLLADHTGVGQVVLGIDARQPGACRLKLYLVLRAGAPDLVLAVLRAAGAGLPAPSDAARVYILGLDFAAGSAVEGKLYFQLDAARLHRAIRNAAMLAPLLATTGDIVLQRCLHSGRAQLYLHSNKAVALGAYLLRRAVNDPPTATLVALHAATERALSSGHLEPRIISFALDGQLLRPERANVYFHHAGPPPTSLERAAARG